MAQKIVAGNWKMNCDLQEAADLTTAILRRWDESPPAGVDLVLAPPFVHLEKVGALLANHERVHLGAQNCARHAKGAYTGEISAAMLKSVGVSYVILGHSERRRDFGEGPAELSEKLALVFENGMRPVYCCGETKAEREAGRHTDAVRAQLEVILELPPEKLGRLVVAYEPVWAIGTGLTATPEQAQEMHRFIRAQLTGRFGTTADEVPLLYGGSCNDQNAADLFSRPDIDGGLIGGASLKAENFVRIAGSYPS